MEFTVKTVLDDGTNVDESKLNVEENEILVAHLPENIQIQTAGEIHKYLKRKIENREKVISLPVNVEFQVIKIGK